MVFTFAWQNWLFLWSHHLACEVSEYFVNDDFVSNTAFSHLKGLKTWSAGLSQSLPGKHLTMCLLYCCAQGAYSSYCRKSGCCMRSVNDLKDANAIAPICLTTLNAMYKAFHIAPCVCCIAMHMYYIQGL